MGKRSGKRRGGGGGGGAPKTAAELVREGFDVSKKGLADAQRQAKALAAARSNGAVSKPKKRNGGHGKKKKAAGGVVYVKPGDSRDNRHSNKKINKWEFLI